jgi:hypothetical protein
VVGGGFVTALAVPLIDVFGLLAFTIGAAAITVALTVWGMRRGAATQPLGRVAGRATAGG